MDGDKLMLKKSDIKDIYILSPMQQGMLFHSIIDDNASVYFEQANFSIKGYVDISLFEKSFNYIIEKYDPLRTVFLYEKVNQPLQVVLKKRNGTILFDDISSLEDKAKKVFIEEFKQKDRGQGFDLSKDLLMRISVIRTDKEAYEIIWSFHHIIMDGWCLGIILEDFFKVYSSLLKKKPIIDSNYYPYRDYIKWLQDQNKNEALDYWKTYLENYEQAVSIPQKYGSISENIYLPQELKFELDKETTRGLEGIARDNQISINGIFQAIWGLMLQRYNYTNDVVFGTVVSGRPSEVMGIEKMVGLFINTIPIRIQENNIDFIELSRKVQLDISNSIAYDYVPLADIQSGTALKNNLFNHVLVFENYPMDKQVGKMSNKDEIGFSIEAFNIFENTNYNFNLIIMPGEVIALKVLYNENVYSKDIIEKIIGNFNIVVKQVIENPQINVTNINIVDKEESNKILEEFNDTKLDYPKDKTIHQLFEEQVEKTPNNIAAESYGEKLTYIDLNKKANQLARKLRDKGVNPDCPVAIMVEKSLDMIVGIMAVLKAGGVFIPVDPEHPEDRIEYMLGDSKAKIMLTQNHLINNITFNGEIVNIQNEDLYVGVDSNLDHVNTPNDLLYMIYTSGSTGKPKGTMLEHKNMVNLVNFEYEKTNIDFSKKVLQFTTISFDVCYQEIFSTLLAGGQLSIVSSDDKKDVEKLLEYIEVNDIEVIFMATAYLRFITNEERYIGKLSKKIKHIITAGEQLVITELFKNYLKEHKVYLHNHYGPSETHVVSTYTVDPNRSIEDIPPIGKPISNTKLYIVKDERIVPIGIVGELYIAGDCVGRGYLNKAELTSEKFIDNPFNKGERLYKTGDLARWLNDGNIEFIGRADHQVKIRGFRIELGEIENKLLTNEAIKEAVVIAKEDIIGNKYLCAYISANKEFIVSELREYLTKELPEYMVPSYFVQLEKLPLTQNGKVDRKALPEPDGRVETGSEYEAPRNLIEEKLVSIWQEVLGSIRIGINDNFFDLGGHSLKATSVIAKIHKELNVEIPLKEIFKTPTIAGLYEYIKGLEESIYDSIEPVNEREYYQLSSAQKRVYTLQQFDLDSISYNIHGVFELEGKMDVERLNKAFRTLIDRHESLRTSFEVIEGEIVQKIHKSVNFEIEHYKVQSQEEINVIVKEFVRAFDLSQPTQLRVGIVEMNEESHILIYDMHHIISDGTSMGIIVEEFRKIYAGEELEPLRIQYKDFSEWQNELLRSEKIKKEEQYWLNRFGGEIPVLNLPTDYERPMIQSFEGATKSFQADKKLTNGLRQIAKSTGSTMYMVLLASYNLLLSKYSGQEDIVVGSAIAGRPYADLQNIIGMFVNTLAMRNFPESKKTFREFLLEVKENSLGAYENQEYQFEELIEKINVVRDFSRNPLFDVMFAMQNVEIGKVSVEGLKIKPYKSDSKISKFDLTLNAEETKENIVFTIEYCTKLFKEETIERLYIHLHKIMEAIVYNIDIKLSDIDIVAEAEKNKLLYEFNNTASEYPMDKTIHQIFEVQVMKTPENIAAVYKEKQITYKELNQKANQLARVLKNKGVGPDSIVGIMVEPSMEMIIGILGILKAGGAYLPIDKEYPRDRIEYMLQDSEAKLLLTKKAVKGEISYSGDVIFLEDKKLYEGECENLEAACAPNNLAYVIYTSGSTGKPKGVMIEHKSLINMSKWYEKYYEVSEEDRTTKYAGFGFDASVWEIFPYLIAGASIHLIEEELKLDILKLNEYYKANKITISFLPTQICEQFIQLENEYLRCVLTGGDKLKQYKSTSYKVVNNYGPTENTIVTTSFIVDKEYNNIPIGQPIVNTRVYIVDKYNNLQTIGVPGELCISGDSLARGYLNRKELTAEKFVDNPFELGTKMYKTGDLARWLPDGNIEFLGRIDLQVKIRGFRIELGEIENQLLNCENVKEAVVIDKNDEGGNKYLCAYVVAEKEITVAELREQLGKKLPEYMIPSYFVQLEKVPLTPNGKVDKKSLPDPDGSVAIGIEYEAPRNEIEEKLAAVWQEVLGLKRVGINENFFELGGHSLKATSLIGKMHKELDVEIPLKVIFNTPTIKGISEYIEKTTKRIYTAIELAEKKAYYEVSSAQKRMYMLQQFNLEGIGYNMPGIMEVEGKLNIENLEKAFKRLLQRHETLRTSFETKEEQIVQIVHENIDFKVEYFNVESNEKAIDHVVKAFVRPFDLNNAPLIRVGVIRVEENKHILMYDMHHIISDGVSMGVLVNEFVKLYEGEDLEGLRIQYKDYSEWQNRLLKSEEMKKQEQYWINRYEGEIPILNLPTDFARPTVQSFEGDNISFKLHRELTNGLRRIAKETGSTMYMILLSGVNILLSRYSGQEDIIVGSPIAGRPHVDLEKIIGMFVNTLAMRNYPEKGKSYKEFLKEVKENSLNAFENQDYQFEELVDKLNIHRDISRNPLFDVMFAMQNMNSGDIRIKDLIFKEYKQELKVAKFDLSFTASEVEEEILLNIQYSSKLFKLETIERLIGHLVQILETVTKDVNISLAEIELLTEEEKKKLLDEFNDTHFDYPRDKTIQQLFEEQVERTPDNTAIVFEDRSLTYRELNERANRLAITLREKGIRNNSIAAIMVERSLEMIVGIIGILKAGGAYLPIDPKYPENRIKYMLENSEAKLLLTGMDMKENTLYSGETLNLLDETVYGEEIYNLKNVNSSKDIAYIIYTSGSTGNPKGVMIEHNSAINTLMYMQQKYPVGEGDKYLLKTSYTFDVSVTEIFGWFIGCGSLVILKPEVEKDAVGITNAIEKHKVSHINFVPSMLNIFIDSLDGNEEKIKSLKYVFAAGEALSKELTRKFLNISKTIKLENIYGPTETTIYVTRYSVKGLHEAPTVPIGKPFGNTYAYILNESKQLQPIGVAGELCISGDGVARGYLNNEELTAEKFILNPFIAGQKMYKTGDLARWISDGNIEFLGRIDHQVKIRGFRIELGEIENQLLKNKLITEAVVMDKEDKSGNKYLCAYLVAEKELTTSELREFLGKKIPDYMIPSYFIYLEKLPLSQNGKIDRKALPEPDGSIVIGTEYEAPTNEIEETLAGIWTTVLGLERVGINDNFFDIGGHSLKATAIVGKIHKELDVQVPINEMFKAPTIKGISEYIEKASKCIYYAIDRVEEKEYYELSSAQKRIYTLQQFELNNTSYNMPMAFELEGELDTNCLSKAFRKLIERHESLRTSFEVVEGQIVQKVHKTVEFEIEQYEVQAEEELEGISKDFVRTFDLSKAAQIRVALVKVDSRRHILMYDMHHIISDGTSMGIIVEEFSRLYAGEGLMPLRIQYKDFSEWQNELLGSEKIKKQEEYWINQFSGEIPVLNLPLDYDRPAVQSFDGAIKNFQIAEDVAEGLRQIGKSTGSTMYMVLLAAFNVLLSKYSGQEDIVVGSPIAGRPYADLQSIIGMFVNTLPMRNYPEGNKSFREFLLEVKENALGAYENQEYQFEELVGNLNIARDFSRSPLFDVMFVLQNTEVGEINLEGLTIKPCKSESKISKFDMTLTAVEAKENINLCIEYCTKLFKEETIEKLCKHLYKIMEAVVKNLDIRLSDIDIVTEEEKVQLLYDFNNTTAEYPGYKTIHQLFEEQVEKTPDNIALVFEEKQVTYKELNARANRLARTLREKGAKTDCIVAIMVERSLEMIIGMLAIMKSGGAYLPIDPEYPVDRIRYMLEDSNTDMLITQAKLIDKAQFSGIIVDLDKEDTYSHSMCNLENISTPENLAYVIYTSGSTGLPKGVMIENRSIAATLKWRREEYRLDEKDSVLQLFSNSFDGFVTSFYTPIISGARVVLLNDSEAKDVFVIKEKIERYKITHFISVPSMCLSIMENITDNAAASLRIITLAGEALTPKVVNQCKNMKTDMEIVNEYGPTENSVVSTIMRDVCNGKKITIGKPKDNTKIYILANNKLQPIGVPGEICISGEGLARGYLNKAELTAERFIENPFVPGERMYKTGDLGRWLPDGNIEFLGRIDHQVKIRGYRIELGEIENKLLSHQEIKEVVVIAKENKNDKFLCAYIVSDREQRVLELREYLLKELPNYMIPSYFIQLEKLPMTPNGKVDRKALPEPEGNMDRRAEYEAPRNEIEEKISGIWDEILSIGKIGIDDNFFEIGGHSIKATNMIAKLHKELNVEIPLKELFKAPTIRGLSQYIQGQEKSIYASIQPVQERESYALSSAQKRIYTLQQFEENNISYNIPGVFQLEGELDVNSLSEAFRKLIDRHESLRTSFEVVEGEIVQRVHRTVEFEMEKFEIQCEEEVEEILKGFIRPFKLSKASQIRVGLVKVNQRKHILMYDLHHIISDGTSMGIIMDEFGRLYAGEALTPLRIQYKDFSEWQNELLRSEKIKKQEQYWINRFNGDVPILSLPTDYERPAIQSFKGDNVSIEIDKEHTLILKQIARETGATLYMTLLAVYNVLLSKYSGQEDIVVGTPIAGRPHADLQNIVGMFVNTLAMRNFPEANKSFREFLNEVKLNSLQDFENQDYQFEELVDKLNIKRNLSRNPLFDVVFTMQNSNNTSIGIKGLSIKPFNFNDGVIKFDLEVTAIEFDEKMLLNICFCTSIFKRDSIEKMAEDFKAIVEKITENSEVKIGEINLLYSIAAAENIEDEDVDFNF